MIKNLFFITLLTIPSLGLAIPSSSEKEDVPYHQICYIKNLVDTVFSKEILDGAISSLKSDEAMYNKYIKGYNNRTLMYQITKIEYKYKDENYVYCSMTFILKPNKEQKTFEMFKGDYMINYKEVLKRFGL